MTASTLNLSLFLLFFCSSAFADTSYVHEYTDTLPKDYKRNIPPGYLKYLDQIKSSFVIKGSVDEGYKKSINYIEVPGYISATRIAPLAKIVGPNDNDHTQYQVGETVFIQWANANKPKEGERFTVYSPIVVLQNMGDPTDFIVRRENILENKYKDGYRLAGYLYESTGTIRIGEVNKDLIVGMIEKLVSGVSVNDLLMNPIAVAPKIEPNMGGESISAAVVSGSPYNRISNNQNEYLYINRGSHDGIQLGQIFEAVENVSIDQHKSEIKRSLGEVIVVYVSDYYSTAIINKQFDVIRLGALLKSKQDDHNILPKQAYAVQNISNISAPPPIQTGAELKSMPKAQEQEPKPEAKKPAETLNKVQAINQPISAMPVVTQPQPTVQLATPEPSVPDAPANQAVSLLPELTKEPLDTALNKAAPKPKPIISSAEKEEDLPIHDTEEPVSPLPELAKKPLDTEPNKADPKPKPVISSAEKEEDLPIHDIEEEAVAPPEAPNNTQDSLDTPIANTNHVKNKVSALDELEKQEKAKELSEEEKETLERLAKQEARTPHGDLIESPDGNIKTENAPSSDSETDAANSDIPQMHNAFKDLDDGDGKKKPIAKKELKKKSGRKKSNDEEELNQLMMQN